MKKAIIFGFLLWAILFMVALLFTPIRFADRTLYESIMPVVVVTSTVVFINLYFMKVENGFVLEGIVTGMIWLTITVTVDLLMFSSGSLKMGVVDYIKDIGIAYLMIPVITTGSGYLLTKKRKFNYGRIIATEDLKLFTFHPN